MCIIQVCVPFTNTLGDLLCKVYKLKEDLENLKI